MTLDEAIYYCDYAFGFNLSEYEELGNLLKELKEYRDLEEQGLLLNLPCKIGDTVYSVEVYEVEEFIVTHFDFCKDSIHAYHKYIYIGEMGHTVFATKEEAEQELKRLESEQCKV